MLILEEWWAFPAPVDKGRVSDLFAEALARDLSTAFRADPSTDFPMSLGLVNGWSRLIFPLEPRPELTESGGRSVSADFGWLSFSDLQRGAETPKVLLNREAALADVEDVNRLFTSCSFGKVRSTSFAFQL